MSYFKEMDIENQDLILNDFKNYLEVIGKNDKKINYNDIQNYVKIRYYFIEANLQGVGSWNKLEKNIYIKDIIKENYIIQEKKNKKRLIKINFDLIYYDILAILLKIKPIEGIIKAITKNKIKNINKLNYKQLVKLWNTCDYMGTQGFDIFLNYIEQHINEEVLIYGSN